MITLKKVIIVGLKMLGGTAIHLYMISCIAVNLNMLQGDNFGELEWSKDVHITIMVALKSTKVL